MRKTLFFMLVMVILIGIVFQPVSMAASFFDVVSTSLETEIGYSNYQSIIHQKQVVPLPPVESERLNNVFSRLVACSSRKKEVNFSLTVVKDDSVNAFALPGGYIFVNTGLLSFAKTDGELAGVLGHEIAHVDRRHSMKAITRAVGMAFIVNAMVNRSQVNNKDQINALAQISLSLVELGFSRENEFEADKCGVQFMRRAGYNKQEILNFWHRMESEDGGGKSPAFMQLLSTHPPTADRIKRIQAM